MGHGFWGNLHRLAWASRAIYIVLILLVVFSLRACFYTVVTTPWRIYYIVATVFSTMYLTYAILLLTDVLSLKDYRIAASWAAVFLFSLLLWPSVLHSTENQVVQHKIQEDHHGD
jgi:hypothetical protein